MTGEQATLRRALTELSDEVVVTDLRRRVAVARHRRRQRQYVAVAAAVVCAMVLVAAGLGRAARQDSAPPARGVPVIDLASAPLGQVDRAQMLVTDPQSRISWSIGASGRVVHNDVRNIEPAGPFTPLLSADGRTVVQVSEVLPTVGDLETSRIHLQTFAARPRTVDHSLFGAPIPRYATVSPDGRTVAVFVAPVPAAGYAGGVQLVDVSDGTTRDIEVPEAGQTLTGSFSRDGRRLALVSVDGGMVGSVDVVAGRLTSVHAFAADAGTIRNEAGWALSPDADRAVVPTFASTGPWTMVSLRTGALGPEIHGPIGDRLLGWTADGHLVWGRPDEAGTGYSIRATTLRGTHTQLLYRLRLASPYIPELPPVVISQAFRVPAEDR